MALIEKVNVQTRTWNFLDIFVEDAELLKRLKEVDIHNSSSIANYYSEIIYTFNKYDEVFRKDLARIKLLNYNKLSILNSPRVVTLFSFVMGKYSDEYLNIIDKELSQFGINLDMQKFRDILVNI